jgi:hypothetical protein
LLEKLAAIGIYGWGHLVQVIVLVAVIIWVALVIWNDVTKAKRKRLSATANRKAHTKTLILIVPPSGTQVKQNRRTIW